MLNKDHILKLRKMNYSYADIGAIFGVSRQLIWAFVNGYVFTRKKPKQIQELYRKLIDNSVCEWGEKCIDQEGFPEYQKHNLIIHHKDFNRDNDDPANLAVLCKKCHSFFHGLNHKN